MSSSSSSTTAACTAVALSIAASLSAAMSGCATDGQGAEWSSRPRLAESQAQLASTDAQLNDTGGSVTTSTAPALREKAVDLLRQAGESTNPLLRANAIEAMSYAPQALPAACRAGLADDNRGVRFAAAMTIGRFKLEAEAPLLLPLLDDDSDSVRAAAMYGLHRNGHSVDLTPLAEMIVSNNPEIKGNAALILGELGDSTAVPLLRQAGAASTPMINPVRERLIQLQIAEAMVRLGDVNQIQVVRAALFTPVEQGEITALACLISGRLGDAEVVPNLTNLALRDGRRREPAEIRLSAALALAQLGAGHTALDVPLAYVGSEQSQLRAQAALTLGAIAAPQSIEALAGLMSDRSPIVQVAAAGAFLQATTAADQRLVQHGSNR